MKKIAYILILAGLLISLVGCHSKIDIKGKYGNYLEITETEVIETAGKKTNGEIIYHTYKYERISDYIIKVETTEKGMFNYYYVDGTVIFQVSNVLVKK